MHSYIVLFTLILVCSQTMSFHEIKERVSRVYRDASIDHSHGLNYGEEELDDSVSANDEPSLAVAVANVRSNQNPNETGKSMNLMKQDSGATGTSSSQPRPLTKDEPTATVSAATIPMTNQPISSNNWSAAMHPSRLAGSEAPRSDRQHILEIFKTFFSQPRSHEDQSHKDQLRKEIIERLKKFGLENSSVQTSKFDLRRKPAFSNNIISIIPGRHHHTKDDQIVLIGAHWDSYYQAPGVDDNGSGSACLLEIARMMSQSKCVFNHTVMIVWFDYEEQGKFGSEFFVNEYLFPQELERYQSKFLGAFILDMILVRDKENNTQTLPQSIKTKLPEFSEELDREKYRGDFLASWTRKIWDEPLENTFRSSWVDMGHKSRTFKTLKPELPQSRMPTAEERYDWKDFFRSDHASFWFPQLTSSAVRRTLNMNMSSHTSLNAILITDLGPWRKSYQKCYHSACDDEHFLTDDNLTFMQQTIDALSLTILRIGQGQCNSVKQVRS